MRKRKIYHMFEEYYDTKSNLGFFAYVKDKKTVLFSNSRFNGLFLLDLETWETQFIGRFTEASEEIIGLHWDAKKYGSKIFFFRRIGAVIDVYDLVYERFETIKIPVEWLMGGQFYVSEVIMDSSVFYVMPRYKSRFVLVYDADMEIFLEPIVLGEKLISCGKEEDALAVSFCFNGGKIYFPVWNTNCLAVINVNDNTELIIQIEEARKLCSIGFDGEYFWFSEWGNILKYNPSKGITERYDNVLQLANNYVTEFLFDGKQVLALPLWAENVKCLKEEKGEWEELELRLGDCKIITDEMQRWRAFKNMFINEDELIIVPVIYKEIIQVQGEKVSHRLLETKKENIPKRKLRPGTLYYEKDDLQQFINLIIDM